MVKRILIVLVLSLFYIGPVAAQEAGEQENGVTLESFEKCNNWARHYCRSGNHEKMVNYLLLKMKERGMTLTTAVIKSVAQRTLKSTGPPPEDGGE